LENEGDDVRSEKDADELEDEYDSQRRVARLTIREVSMQQVGLMASTARPNMVYLTSIRTPNDWSEHSQEGREEDGRDDEPVVSTI
jgi:hypothetical protein